jgi:hypothetical protein
MTKYQKLQKDSLTESDELWKKVREKLAICTQKVYCRGLTRLEENMVDFKEIITEQTEILFEDTFDECIRMIIELGQKYKIA